MNDAVRFTQVIAAAIVLTAAGAGVYAQGALISWNDSTRDVYVGNEVDHGAQVLVSDSPNRLAVISPKLGRIVVLDLTAQTVSTMSKDAIRFTSDRTSATSAAAAATQAVGKYVKVDGTTYLLSLDGTPILIRSHPGVVGEITEQKLFETVPVWKSLMEAYQPRPEVVSALKSNGAEAEIIVALGSWCGDSKNYVPKLLKALQAAGNEKLKLKFIGIDSQFHEPIETVQGLGLVNVPTIIVRQGGRETGRIVETPAAETMEQDLAAILSGKPNAHTGRWDRGPKIAEGVYTYRGSGSSPDGEEKWELFSTPEGGQLLHSEIRAGGVTTEIWHRIDAHRRPSFVEITKFRGNAVTRTRYRFGDRSLTARLRGNDSGSVEQTLSVPERFAFSSQAAAADAFWLSGRGAKPAVNYVAPVEFEQTVGVLESLSYEEKGQEAARVPAGEFQARHVVRKGARDSWDLWLHPQLSIPVRGKSSTGAEFILSSFKFVQAGK